MSSTGLGLFIVSRLNRNKLDFTKVNKRVASLHLQVEDRSFAVVFVHGLNSSTANPAFSRSLGGVFESSPNGDSIVLLPHLCGQ